MSFLIGICGNVLSQWDGNTTPTYEELIEIYKDLSEKHKEIQLFEMGPSDYGLPIYLCVVNGGSDSLSTFEKARKSTTILVNNGIHPGEPDGINACLIWIQNWIEKGKKTDNLPVMAFIPAYNVGGMMNRSSSSRANQNGPEEYGFRGNAQNLDLNRDFIKMDSKNAFTFAKIFHGLDPDVFLDTHVSNGADYQYTLTYIASVRERMAPGMAGLVHDQMIPQIEDRLLQEETDMIPYVNLIEDVPEKGMTAFDDLPRYAQGYAALFHSIAFTVETHMLKPFPERVQVTLRFLEECVRWSCDHKESIEESRREARDYDRSLIIFPLNYSLSETMDSIRFKGFEHSYPQSDITEQSRLKYHEDRPFDKMIPYQHSYVPVDSVRVPKYYVVGGQCTDVLERLKANNVHMKIMDKDEILDGTKLKVISFDSPKNPYEGHFLHSKTKLEELNQNELHLKHGDVLISTDQDQLRFIVSTLEPIAPDSYFAWNYFDSYLQQKEYFSPYVFEDFAREMLESDAHLNKEFQIKKEENSDFANNSWVQLYFLYTKSKFYEPTHNILPVFKVF